MAVTRAQKIRLGVFLAVAIVALVGSMIVLAGMKLGEERDFYTVRFADEHVSLSGLDVGSPVKYSGIRVGRVEGIRVDPEDVSVIEVTLSLDEKTPVAEDSAASLGSLGITGLKYIELTRGSKGARHRKPGEVIPSGPSLIDDLTNQAAVISRQVSEVLDRVSKLTGPDMQKRVASVLDRTDKLLETYEAIAAENRQNIGTLSTKLSATLDNVEKLTGEMYGTARRVNQLLDGVRPGLTRMASEGGRLMRDISATRELINQNLEASQKVMANIEKLSGLEGAQRTLGSVNRLLDRSTSLVSQAREDLVESIGYFRETAENMSAFSARVKDDPSLLLLGNSEEEAY